MTDEGEAYICGHPVSTQLQAAQQLTGYCPQFDGLPGQMTGTRRHVAADDARIWPCSVASPLTSALFAVIIQSAPSCLSTLSNWLYLIAPVSVLEC
jgi:hypothetical protein